MTNAEVYIGDEDLIDQFIDEFDEFACEQDCAFEYHYLKEMLVRFFKQERKPTLAEDERVILRNIDETVFTHIGRDTKSSIYDLYLRGERTRCVEIDDILKPDLFTFIKERRRIRDKGVAR